MENESRRSPLSTGIAGLDEVLHGGYPLGRATLVVGTPGSGKTILGIQFLVAGVRDADESGLMISFEEPPAALRAIAVRLGMSADTGHNATVMFIDGRPMLETIGSGAFDLNGLVAIVVAEIRRSKVRRVVFDGIDVLFSATGRAAALGKEFRRLIQCTDAEGVTSLVTLKPGTGDHDLPQRIDALEYAADAVVRIDYRLIEGLLQRVLRVVKVRDADFASGEHPFLITARGLSVSCLPAKKKETITSYDRVSTGISRLDDMLDGGLLRSSVTLVSGLPGTAKSTLGANFLLAALARGEQCLLVALDEPAPQLVANVRSVGIDLQPFIASGHLRLLSRNAAGAIGHQHYLTIVAEIEEWKPTTLVIDPISALEKAGGSEIAIAVAERLTNLVKERGMLALFTAIANIELAERETTTLHISTIADTWMHLNFGVKGGERNRTLTIIKSRGTAHSNQIREMSLSADGVTLEDVYEFDGDFLLGSARLERTQQDNRDVLERETRVRELLRELEDRRENANSKLRDIKREMLDVDEQIIAISAESVSLEAQTTRDRNEVRVRRQGHAIGDA